jgi:hypothetical protein
MAGDLARGQLPLPHQAKDLPTTGAGDGPERGVLHHLIQPHLRLALN